MATAGLVRLAEGTTNGTPASGYGHLEVLSTGLQFVDDDGRVSQLSPGGVMSAIITPTALAANTDNWNPTSLSTSNVIRASSSANYNVTGLVALAAGVTVRICNIGSFDIVLKSQSTSSSAANRFAMPYDLRLFPDSQAEFWYDGTSTRWRIIGHTGAFFGTTLQTVQASKTDTFTTTSSSYTALTGISKAITPKSTASQIEVTVSITINMGGGGIGAWRITRGGSAIFVGDAAGSRTRATGGNSATDSNAVATEGMVYIDSPASTSSTTYAVEVAALDGTTLAVNRSATDTDAARNVRSVSSITLREICQ